jgi:hypothetical protein
MSQGRSEPAQGMTLKLKRVYDKTESGDRCGILVGRRWPRGISKQEANISLWLKNITPSGGLGKWYRHHERLVKTPQYDSFDGCPSGSEAVVLITKPLQGHQFSALLCSRCASLAHEAVGGIGRRMFTMSLQGVGQCRIGLSCPASS